MQQPAGPEIALALSRRLKKSCRVKRKGQASVHGCDVLAPAHLIGRAEVVLDVAHTLAGVDHGLTRTHAVAFAAHNFGLAYHVFIQALSLASVLLLYIQAPRTLSTRPIQKAAFIVRVRDDPNSRLACDDITRAKDGTLTAVRPARGGLEALTDLEVAVKYSEFYGQAPV